MSGGSWNYLYQRVQEAADLLLESSNRQRQRLGRSLARHATALHDIEWVDSCDMEPGDEVEAIQQALEENE